MVVNFIYRFCFFYCWCSMWFWGIFWWRLVRMFLIGWCLFFFFFCCDSFCFSMDLIIFLLIWFLLFFCILYKGIFNLWLKECFWKNWIIVYRNWLYNVFKMKKSFFFDFIFKELLNKFKLRDKFIRVMIVDFVCMICNIKW